MYIMSIVNCMDYHYFSKETLINCRRGIKRKARGAHEPGRIWKYVEVTSAAQRVGAVREPPFTPAQAINQRFPNTLPSILLYGIFDATKDNASFSETLENAKND